MKRAIAYGNIKELSEKARQTNDPSMYYEGYCYIDLLFTELYAYLIKYLNNEQKIKPAHYSNLKFFLKNSVDSFKYPPKGRFPVAFHPTSRSHIRQQLPVAQELRKKGIEPLFILSKSHLAEWFKPKGFKTKLILPSRIMPQNEFNKVSITLRNLVGNVSWLTDSHADNISSIIFNSYPIISSVAKSFRRDLKKYDVKLLVAGNDILRDESLSTKIARKEGVTTACIMHGMMTSDNPCHNNIDVDNYFLFGKYFVKYFTEFGFKEENLFVHGVPALDQYINKQRFHGNEIAAKLGFNKKFILVAFSGAGNTVSETDHKNCINMLAEAAKQLPDTNFLIKLHVKDKKNYYNEFGGFENVRVIADDDSSYEDYNIIDYILEAEAIISVVSTSIVEAMFFKVPVIAINPERKYSNFDYLDDTLVSNAEDPEELVRAIKAINTIGTKEKVDNALKFTTDLFGMNDGKASERVAGEMIRIVIETN